MKILCQNGHITLPKLIFGLPAHFKLVSLLEVKKYLKFDVNIIDVVQENGP